MQSQYDYCVLCKLLNFNTLENAFQKCHFCTPKGELLGAERGTFASQKWHFWKAKVQLHIYTPVPVYLYGARLYVFFTGIWVKSVIVYTRNTVGIDWRIDPNGKQQSADGKNGQGVIRPTRLSY